jgi:hypothetical protein
MKGTNQMKNNIPQEIINHYITQIFENGLKITYDKYSDGETLQGYYLMPKYNENNLDYNQLTQMKQLERIFVNLKAKARKMYGNTNKADFENQWAEALAYLTEALINVFSGTAKVEEALQVESADDIIRIISTEKLASKLCRYCITYVDLKFKTLMKSKGNPDYYRTSKGYEPISYYYLDDTNDDGLTSYEELDLQEQAHNAYETGPLTDYILESYVDLLTHKQQLFCQCFIWFGKDKQGHISTEDGIILYNKQEVIGYNKKIKGKILSFAQDDLNLVTNDYNRLTLDWKGDAPKNDL